MGDFLRVADDAHHVPCKDFGHCQLVLLVARVHQIEQTAMDLKIKSII